MKKSSAPVPIEVKRAVARGNSTIPTQQPADTPWPTLKPLDSDLPPVASFDESLMPEPFRPLIRDVAERMQVPLDYPAVVTTVCLAGVVNRRAMIQPKGNDSGWTERPNLWGGIVAPPGQMKSPAIQACTAPIRQIQADWNAEDKEKRAEYEQQKEEHELRRAAWREDFKKSVKGQKSTPERPADELSRPTARRLLMNDATFEAMHETMSENPAGILMVRDELTGWLAQLDRPGREGERAFALQAWNGSTGHTIDRIGRGTVHVDACCMSLLGGIQPGRLRSYLVDALEDGPSNDGLIQRFQLLVWPDVHSSWEYVDRSPDARAEERARKIFRTLVELDAADPVRYRFSPAAQMLFINWLGKLEAKVRGDEFHPALISHLSKYRSLMPSLAVLFEMADWVVGNGSCDLVSFANTERAEEWCDYLESHAKRVYSCVVSPHMRGARELGEKLKRRKIGEEGCFSSREVYLKGWTGLDTPESVKRAAEVLEDAGWVREVSGEIGSSGGRPSTRFEVNPAVFKQCQ